MLTQPLVIAHKELVDHGRDVRAVALSALYALMGPAITLLALLQQGSVEPGSPAHRVWPIIAAVFALMAAFTGSLAAAMDTIAGERERRSLVPLMISACSRSHLIVGKWLALSALSIVSVAACAVAFALVLRRSGGWPIVSWALAAPALLSLGMLAAAAEIFVSTLCRSTKEANTYLSLLLFGLMAFAMWIAFRPPVTSGWTLLVPLLGQQQLLAAVLAGGVASVVQAGLLAIQSAALSGATAAAAVMVVAAASKLFQRDEAVHVG